MEKSKSILFYSNKSKACTDLLVDIQSKPSLSNLLIPVCIDSLAKNKIPSFVKTVPTLYIGQDREPLHGDQVFFWVTLQNSKQSPSQPPSSMPPPPATPQQGPPIAEPGAWQSGEMGQTYSDAYSYLDNTKPLQHSFSFLPPDATIGSSPPAAAAGDITSRLELFKNQRNMDVSR